MIFKNRKGFTLMELVVSTAIIGTLAALAVPSYMSAGNKAKGAKSLDNVNVIGSAILQEYNRVVAEGDAGGNAIATFQITAGTVLDTLTNPEVISYGSDGAGSIKVKDIFPAGVPKSPFNEGFYVVAAVTPGAAIWSLSGGLVALTITQRPSITIQDPAHSVIQGKFTP